MRHLAFIGMLLTLNACGTLSGNVENREIASDERMSCGKVIGIEAMAGAKLVITILTDDGSRAKVISRYDYPLTARGLLKRVVDITNARALAIASYQEGGHYCSSGEMTTLRSKAAE